MKSIKLFTFLFILSGLFAAVVFFSSGQVSAAGELSIVQTSKFTNGVVGQFFSASFEVTGGTPVYTWQYSLSDLPSGLGFKLVPDATTNCASPTDAWTTSCANPISTGQRIEISGTPLSPGVFPLKFQVADSSGKTGGATFTLVFDSVNKLGDMDIISPTAGANWFLESSYTISWNPGTLATKNVNIYLDPYIACLYATPPCAVLQIAPYVIAENVKNSGSFTWTIPGSLATRFISVSRITVVTVDGSGKGVSGVITISPKPVVSESLQIVGSSELRSKIGEQINYKYEAKGGTPPYKWSVVGTLPQGVVFVPEQIQCLQVSPEQGITTPCESDQINAYFTGAPKQIGSNFLELKLIDSKGNMGYKKISFLVLGQDNVVSVLAPGKVIRTSDHAVRLILDNNQYYSFTSMEDFLGKGYRLHHISYIDKVDLSGYQEHTFYRPSGTTFRYAGDKTVYYLTRSYCKQAYTSLAILLAWKVQLADIVLFGDAEEFPVCNVKFVQLPELAAVKGSSSTVYILEKGYLRPVVSGEAFIRLGYSFSNVITLGDKDIDEYPKGEDIK